MIGSSNLSNSKLETKKLRFQTFRRTSALTDNKITNGNSKATVKQQKNKNKTENERSDHLISQTKDDRPRYKTFWKARTSAEHIIKSENTIF